MKRLLFAVVCLFAAAASAATLAVRFDNESGGGVTNIAFEANSDTTNSVTLVEGVPYVAYVDMTGTVTNIVFRGVLGTTNIATSLSNNVVIPSLLYQVSETNYAQPTLTSYSLIPTKTITYKIDNAVGVTNLVLGYKNDLTGARGLQTNTVAAGFLNGTWSIVADRIYQIKLKGPGYTPTTWSCDLTSSAYMDFGYSGANYAVTGLRTGAGVTADFIRGIPVLNGGNTTNLSAARLVAGGTLSPLNAASLTNLNATSLLSGTMPWARGPGLTTNVVCYTNTFCFTNGILGAVLSN